MVKTYPYLKSALVMLLLGASFSVGAQQHQDIIQTYLQQEKSQWKLSDNDIRNWTVSDQYDNPQTGVTYTYLHQQVAGIRVFNAVSTMAIKDGKVVHYANRFFPNASQNAHATQPALSAEQAIESAAGHLNLSLQETPRLLATETGRLQYTFTRAGIAQENIKAELVLVQVGPSLRLAWNVSIAPLKSADWWNIRIDALNGQFLEKNNWTTHCNLGSGFHRKGTCTSGNHAAALETPSIESLFGNYNVYALPVEAPTFGVRSLLSDPHSTVASPYGWHDTDGADGAEHTITRGNNVYAYEDLQDSNLPGYSPDGGPSLNFDFPIDTALPPVENQDAILTNLFYMNNMLHDVLYLHGFDERAGNFQENNYSGEGAGNDYVVAEGQDGGGTNNANFSTPEDGDNGRMQMYLWPAEVSASMQVLVPQVIAGNYVAIEASFGPGLTTPVTANAVLVNDGVAPTTDGCEPLLSAAELAGKIAIMDRGNCTFISKVNAAEDAGAVAVIVVNNTAGAPIGMVGTGTSGIPAVMISLADGELIKAQLNAGIPVDIKLSVGGGASGQDRDGSLDNGIIAHEYGHGLSNRLTGGPSNSNCLFNTEQGGEGWSDWLGLILTIEIGDAGENSRGIGTYAINDNLGQGIRRFPYSTDMSINPQTYGSLANSSGPHAIGEIWSQTIWEMTWKLIDAEGFDPDWYQGTGGNNTAMKLVIEGMKLQPCLPGYLDARDAILKADELLYQNAHRCLIWEAFAKRGMGANAIQGSSDQTGDEVEDFSLPNFCLTATVAPTANFTADVTTTCFGIFNFTDQSTNTPQFYLWDFGDGNTSETVNPVHTYAVPGDYTVTLVVTNNIGSDTVSLNVSYATLPAPVITGNLVVCEGGSTTLTADVVSGNDAVWSAGDSVVYTGAVFQTPILTAPVTYTVEQLEPTAIQNVGPANNSFGGGGNHNTGFDGRLLFETFAPLKLISVLVYAQGEGDRTIRLIDASGQIVQTVTVFVPNGANRINLNMDIPETGNYSLSNVSQNLYRNNSGAAYPYNINNLISIYSSNATSDELTFYYYFYDWEVQETTCKSQPTEVALTVTPGPAAGFTVVSNSLTANFTDNSSGNVVTWSWNFGDGSPVSTEQNPVHTYMFSGTYEVELTVSNGNCFSTYKQVVVVELGTGANDLNNLLGLQVYPNPATDEVNMVFSQAWSGALELKVTSADGRVVLARSLVENTSRVSINTASLPAGAYQLMLIGDAGVTVRTVAIVR
ncbi:MAG: T9SS-dependent M36 family metallopeptidase [Saprospiraceae bacterium]|nr:T9SS-dependent M36 family metallopeptidase [Saprospiraceae bacterium]